jgi:hypothetical protein
VKSTNLAVEKDLLGLIVEETGEAHDSNPVRLTLACIKQLKTFADFEATSREGAGQITKVDKQPEQEAPPDGTPKRQIEFRLGYTINLNLPATSDAAVFDAIFKSLRENLLREEDG